MAHALNLLEPLPVVRLPAVLQVTKVLPPLVGLPVVRLLAVLRVTKLLQTLVRLPVVRVIKVVQTLVVRLLAARLRLKVAPPLPSKPQ